MLLITSYLIPLLFVILILLFFWVWQNGYYFKVVLFSLVIRFSLVPIFELYGQNFIPAEIPEFLTFYEKWQNLYDRKWVEIFMLGGLRSMMFYFELYAGYLQDIAGESNFIPQRIANLGMSLLILLPCNMLSKTTLFNKLTTSTAFLLLNWPIYLRYSIELGRTLPSILCPLLAIAFFFQTINKKNIFLNIVFFLFFTFLTYCFRTTYILFIPAFIIGYLISIYTNNWHRLIPYIFLGLLSFLFLFYFFFDLLNLFFLDFLFETSLENNDQLGGGSAYLTTIFPNNLGQLIWYLPLHALYFFMSPMVWDVNNVEQFLSCFLALILCLFLFLAFQDKRKHPIIYGIIFSCLFIGGGVKNAGSAQRWRLPLTILAISIYNGSFRIKLTRSHNQHLSHQSYFI